ncbi:small lysine-rich protein 1 [Drosophila grimshawi]|uniref:GH18371 n=1 Tax=Drosophila grimshawi TaxID=7222 RepID=B4JEW4_DROGR|nr:small lysine-rich protein 1 [Drosophila grimshawi]EDV93245.1 GH18371 [Drosophila grimshawi]
MGGKSKKKRNSKDSTSSNAGSGEGDDKKKKEGAGGSKKKAGVGKSIGCDIFNDAAMDNAYYVCHNVQDVLKSRGFPWPDGQKKKKKGKR